MKDINELDCSALKALTAFLDRKEFTDRFPTYESAIDEIIRLTNEAKNPPKKQRGRPKKALEKLFRFFPPPPKTTKEKRKAGKPARYEDQEKVEIIKAIDQEKKEYGIVTDKEYIEKGVLRIFKNSGLPEYRAKMKSKELRNQLKYWRDRTRIRQK